MTTPVPCPCRSRLPHRRCEAVGFLCSLCLLCLLCLLCFLLQAATAFGQNEPRLASIHNLLQARHSQDRVLLRGTVTYHGRELMLQDGSGALAIDPPAATSISYGDEIEVEGRLEMRTGIPIVRNASIRRLWSGSTPLPLAITPDEAAEGAYNGMLVTSEGRLIKIDNGSSGALHLTIDGGNQLFTCILEQRPDRPAAAFEVGATVRCTGVLSVDQTESAIGAGTFLILLRTPADVRQLQAAPWWTPRHLILLFALLLALVWIAYRIHLRNARARLNMVLEERTRIAREIHDTLAQGFAGIALQLQALHRTMGEQSKAAEDHLGMALQMVRRSRAEAHRSIATLRTLHSCADLAKVCERLLRQLTEPAGVALEVVEQGAPRPLSDDVTGQIVRITQEAVANTVEHAGARNVTVAITHAAASLTVEVRDDGHGFDLRNVRSLDTGHFGITGMHERASGIHAGLSIRSGSGGTVLRLHLPLAPTARHRFGKIFRNSRRTVPAGDAVHEIAP